MDKQQRLNYMRTILDEIDRVRSLSNDLAQRLMQLEIDVKTIFGVDMEMT